MHPSCLEHWSAECLLSVFRLSAADRHDGQFVTGTGAEGTPKSCRKDALCADPRVNYSEITATTVNGIVTFSGNVNNLAAKTYAVTEAKKINGVLGMIDKLTVTPSFLWDADISNAARRRILNSTVINSQGIVVTCKDSVVTLSGTVDSYSEEHQAGLLASEVHWPYWRRRLYKMLI